MYAYMCVCVCVFVYAVKVRECSIKTSGADFKHD